MAISFITISPSAELIRNRMSENLGADRSIENVRVSRDDRLQKIKDNVAVSNDR